MEELTFETGGAAGGTTAGGVSGSDDAAEVGPTGSGILPTTPCLDLLCFKPKSIVDWDVPPRHNPNN